MTSTERPEQGNPFIGSMRCVYCGREAEIRLIPDPDHRDQVWLICVCGSNTFEGGKVWLT